MHKHLAPGLLAEELLCLVILMQQTSRMHSQGRSSARKTIAHAALILLFSLLYHLEVTQATTYTVGDSSGWSFSFKEGNWTRGKNFKAGDILVFYYDASLHNVVLVDSDGYSKCTAYANSKTYSKGHDQFKLSKGNHYYICSYKGHCEGGLKLKVYAP